MPDGDKYVETFEKVIKYAEQYKKGLLTSYEYNDAVAMAILELGNDRFNAGLQRGGQLERLTG